jgi:hypothetical protein
MSRALFLGVIVCSSLFAIGGASSCRSNETPEAEPPIDLPEGGRFKDSGGATTECNGSGFSLCGSDCVALATDPKNCGACGKTCKDRERCSQSSCVSIGSLAVKTIFLGDTDRTGTKKPDAWKAFGANLDGIVSTNVANGECKLVNGASQNVRVDGDNGNDNAWGKEVLKLLDPFVPNMTANTNARIMASER